MPLIELTVTEGTLTEQGRRSIRQELARILLRWEQAPDTKFFRAVAWTYLHELPTGAQTTLADDDPRFRVDVTVPVGALSERRKAGFVADATTAVLAAAGLDPDQAMRVWVLIHEQPDGTWGAGGRIVTFADLVALAAAPPGGATDAS